MAKAKLEQLIKASLKLVGEGIALPGLYETDKRSVELQVFVRRSQLLRECSLAEVLFYSDRRGHELHQTFDWVTQVLENRVYTSGNITISAATCFCSSFLTGICCKISRKYVNALMTLTNDVQGRFGVETRTNSLW